MAFITLNKSKLASNYNYLEALFQKHNISWAVVTKLLCGHKPYLEEVIKLGAKEVCDSRISNLKAVKEIDPNVQTVYIKPPAKRHLEMIVQYADVSFNTQFETMQLLSDEAVRQKKIHKVIVMIELGDLREGVMGDHLVEFYASIINLPNIEISGIGSNLNCLHGVMPSEDKLIQLSLYKQLVEAKFNIHIPWVTGGTSVVVPLLYHRMVPKGINHFRIGEMLFFGNNLFTGENIDEMYHDVIKLKAEIIELYEKPKVPIGSLASNPSGEVLEINEDDYGKMSFRAILDLGLLDISPNYLIPVDKDFEVTGASSDMIILDLGDNEHNYQVGDLVTFNLKYMGALALLSSDYIEKKFED
ncbi:alanine racemase [Peijinzhouia sedimentorum]